MWDIPFPTLSHGTKEAYPHDIHFVNSFTDFGFCIELSM